MAFLAKTDFKFSIDLSVLDNLTGSDDTIIDELSAEAVTEMKSFLNSRYDVTVIFNAIGTARDKTIVMYCKDIALYHIHSLYNLRVIPAIRLNRYNHALQWMQDVCEQKINPEGLPVNTSSFIKTGSNTPRINQQQ